MTVFGGLGCKIETGKLYKARAWYSTGSDRWSTIWIPQGDGSWLPIKLPVGSTIMVLDENPVLIGLAPNQITTDSRYTIPHIRVFSGALECTGMIDPNQLEDISE